MKRRILWCVCAITIICALVYWQGCATQEPETPVNQSRLETEPWQAKQETKPPTPGEPILVRHERNKKVYHIYSDPNSDPCPCGKNSDTESFRQYLEITDDIKALNDTVEERDILQTE